MPSGTHVNRNRPPGRNCHAARFTTNLIFESGEESVFKTRIATSPADASEPIPLNSIVCERTSPVTSIFAASYARTTRVLKLFERDKNLMVSKFVVSLHEPREKSGVVRTLSTVRTGSSEGS